MNFLDSEDRKQAALDITVRDLQTRSEVFAVLLIGSQVVSSHNHSSDIDLAVIKDQGELAQYEQRRISDISVDLHYYPFKWFPENSSPVLDLRMLRELSRISEGIVLFSKWKQLDFHRKQGRSAILSPLEGAVLREKFCKALEFAAESNYSLIDRISALHSAAFSLSIWALSTTTYRYQKPKWIMRDLTRAGMTLLSNVIIMLTMGRVKSLDGATQIFKIAYQAIIHGCNLCGLPPLTRVLDAPFKYTYICRTIADAKTLLEQRELRGVAVTSAFNLRFMEALLRTTRDDKVALAWRQRWLSKMLPASAKTCTTVNIAIDLLNSIASDIERTHEDQLRRTTYPLGSKNLN